MGHFSNETRDAWREIAANANAQRPSPGRMVRVTGGRKHIGKSGTVIVHTVSRFDSPFRYATEAQASMREIVGRSGYVVRIRQADGTEFWVSADYVEVVS